MRATELANDLKWRGLSYQATDTDLAKLLTKSESFYCGFDPTSDSLHLGSLLPLLTMKRFQQHGYRPLFLVGGATGMIGDPSGKTQERVFLSEEQLTKNVAGIKKVALKFLEFKDSGAVKAAEIVNNFDWIGKMSAIDYLREAGKYFTVNHMMGKESVRARLEDREHGISYTEFSYMILQAYDFYHLNEKSKCALQIGGSDQWGNITAGIDLIRKKSSKEANGITWPLVTKSDGTKFGKSESGNIWLDPEKTSPYQFYQYLLQIPDADIGTFLKFFSFKTHAEIEALEALVKSAPEKREAQKALAAELTTLVHGADELAKVENATQALFKGGQAGAGTAALDADALEGALSEAPRTQIKKSELDQMTLIDLLVLTKLSDSKGMARKDIQGGGINLNQERVTDISLVIKLDMLVGGRLLVLRKGKKTFHVVQAS